MNILNSPSSYQQLAPYPCISSDERGLTEFGSPLKILYLTSRLPVPPLVKGDTLRDFYIIKELASRGHKVTLVSFFRKNETNDPNLEILKKYCQEIKLIKFDLKKQSLNLATGIYGLIP